MAPVAWNTPLATARNTGLVTPELVLRVKISVPDLGPATFGVTAAPERWARRVRGAPGSH